MSAETNSFVKLMFEVLSSGEYDDDLKAKRAVLKSEPTKDPTMTTTTTIVPTSRVLSSNSGSGVGPHGDVGIKSSRPGAVVQPLMSANSGAVEGGDFRHGSVYRPGQDAQPLQRHNGRRRSPQRMVGCRFCYCWPSADN